jgi:4-carboxymuconolactone decarboxylase
MSQSLRDKGVEMFNTVYCGDLPQPPPPGQDKFFDFMLEGVFGKLWADSTLSMRDRRLVLLGAIAAQGEDMTWTIQARSAMKRGELDQQELEEIILFLTQYVGYPRASKMRMALMGLLAQQAQQKNT